MARGLREEVPREFSDDERWYRFFTTKMIVVLLVGAGFTFLMYRLFSLFNAGVVALIVFGLLTLIALALVAIKVPRDGAFAMYGQGTLLSTLLYRVIVRRKKGRIYVAGIGKEAADAAD